MGKQAKKKTKSDSQASNQKNHNRATRGINTRRRGATWAIRKYKAKVKDEDGKEVEVEKTLRIEVPPRTFWDPWDQNKNDRNKAVEPYDALHLDWRHEMMEYVAEKNENLLEGEKKLRIGKLDLGNGTFLYRVFQGENVTEPDKVFFEIESSRKFVDVREKKRRRKPKKVG
jgi:hypothetical protein